MENGDNAAAPLPGVVNWIRRMSTGAAPAEEGLSEAILGRGSSPLPNATLRAASPTGAGATLHGPHGSGLSPPCPLALAHHRAPRAGATLAIPGLMRTSSQRLQEQLARWR
jgi:hypothetical protein